MLNEAIKLKKEKETGNHVTCNFVTSKLEGYFAACNPAVFGENP